MNTQLSVQTKKIKFRSLLPVRSLNMGRTVCCFVVLFAVLIFASCSPKDQPDKSSCSVDLDMRVTINVTDVAPKEVFNQLAPDPDCAITVYPWVRQHLTLQMRNATVSEVLVAACKQIDCKWTFDGQHLTISLLNFIDKKRMQAQEEWWKKFEVRLPEDMHYEDATVSSVLEDISEVSELEITAWEGEGDQTVTLDISGMTVKKALEAVVRQIDDCEGVVMVKSWNGGNTQYRLVDK